MNNLIENLNSSSLFKKLDWISENWWGNDVFKTIHFLVESKNWTSLKRL